LDGTRRRSLQRSAASEAKGSKGDGPPRALATAQSVTAMLAPTTTTSG